MMPEEDEKEPSNPEELRTYLAATAWKWVVITVIIVFFIGVWMYHYSPEGFENAYNLPEGYGKMMFYSALLVAAFSHFMMFYYWVRWWQSPDDSDNM